MEYPRVQSLPLLPPSTNFSAQSKSPNEDECPSMNSSQSTISASSPSPLKRSRVDEFQGGYREDGLEGYQLTSTSRMEERTEVAPEECPFYISYPEVEQAKRQKRMKTFDSVRSTEREGYHIETKFDAGKLEIAYQVKPRRKWERLSSYKAFSVAGVVGGKLRINDFIHVRPGQDDSNTAPHDNWIAHILEIRAADAERVYLRVYWGYWPDQLPGGAEPYHGDHEIVLSNHMDIIDARTVDGIASVEPLLPWKKLKLVNDLYWRQLFQAIPCRPVKLSNLNRICSCRQFYNPQELLVKCSNPACGKWLHGQCLLKEVIDRVIVSLGLGTPPDEEGFKWPPTAWLEMRLLKLVRERELRRRLGAHMLLGEGGELLGLPPMIVVTELADDDVPIGVAELNSAYEDDVIDEEDIDEQSTRGSHSDVTPPSDDGSDNKVIVSKTEIKKEIKVECDSDDSKRKFKNENKIKNENENGNEIMSRIPNWSNTYDGPGEEEIPRWVRSSPVDDDASLRRGREVYEEQLRCLCCGEHIW